MSECVCVCVSLRGCAKEWSICAHSVSVSVVIVYSAYVNNAFTVPEKQYSTNLNITCKQS